MTSSLHLALQDTWSPRSSPLAWPSIPSAIFSCPQGLPVFLRHTVTQEVSPIPLTSLVPQVPQGLVHVLVPQVPQGLVHVLVRSAETASSPPPGLDL